MWRHERLRNLRIFPPFFSLFQHDWAGITRDADDERGEYHERQGVCDEQVGNEDGGLVQRLEMVINEDIKPRRLWCQD